MDRLLLLASVFASSFGQRTPTISYVSPNISTTRSSTIDMDCSVLYSTVYPVLWMKQVEGVTPIPLSESSSLIIRDNRFSLRYDTASATYTLQLKDVQTSDEGRYECQIIVGVNNKVTKSLYLRVEEPPVINDNSTRSVVVDEFNSATLSCSARGKPTPRIEWRRENNAVLPTGGIIYRGNTMSIHSVKKEDRGTYYCVADNGVGKPTKRNVALEVEFAPTIVDGTRDKVVTQAYNYEVGLTCLVEAYPPASITWIQNGIQRSVNNEYFNVYKGIGVDGLVSSNLKIKSLTEELTGEYVCKAANKLGQTQTTFKVELGYEPNCDVGSCEYNNAAVQLLNTAWLSAVLLLLTSRTMALL